MRCQNPECGKLIEWKPKRKYCLACATQINRDNHRIYVAKNGREPKKHIKKRTVCKCPLCEKLYLSTIRWTGNGMPRIYCDNCKETEMIADG